MNKKSNGESNIIIFSHFFHYATNTPFIILEHLSPNLTVQNIWHFAKSLHDIASNKKYQRTTSTIFCYYCCLISPPQTIEETQNQRSRSIGEKGGVSTTKPKTPPEAKSNARQNRDYGPGI